MILCASFAGLFNGICADNDVAYKRQKELLMINGLPGLINLLSQSVSFIRSHSFAFVKAGSIIVHAMCFIHVMSVGFPCMLASEGTLQVSVRMISGLCLFMLDSAGIRGVWPVANRSGKCLIQAEKEQNSQKKWWNGFHVFYRHIIVQFKVTDRNFWQVYSVWIDSVTKKQ